MKTGMESDIIADIDIHFYALNENYEEIKFRP